MGAAIARFLSTVGAWCTGGAWDMSHSLVNLCLCPLATLVQLARGKLPLPLPKLNALHKELGLLKGAEVLGVELLGCWSMSGSWSEGMSITMALPLAWLSLLSSKSLQSDLTLTFYMSVMVWAIFELAFAYF